VPIPAAASSQSLTGVMISSHHAYKIRPRQDHRGVDLMSDALPFGRLWYGEPNAVSNAIGYAMHYSPSHHAVIRVYDEAGNSWPRCALDIGRVRSNQRCWQCPTNG
jgi:hypothetical protein